MLAADKTDQYVRREEVEALGGEYDFDLALSGHETLANFDL